MVEIYKHYIQRLQDKSNYRTLPTPSQGHDRNLDFSTNDYLDLSSSAEIKQAVKQAIDRFGLGARGSRLLCGVTPIHQELEQIIARDKNCEAALLFPSGFQANFSTLCALLEESVLGQKPLVFFDKNNHSSLYQGVQLAKAELVRYKHLDMNHLESLLKKHQDHPFKFIITETVFGMDGDCVDLNALKELCVSYNAFLYLDEAHATGLYGPKGYGLSTTHDLCEIPHVIMGSFSKALGGSGGYIACSNTVKDYLVNKAGGFIYSTAPSQAVLAGVLKAWELIPKLEEKRTHLKELGHYFSSGLSELGFDGPSYYHIVPVIIGCDKKTIHLKNELLKYNIIVSGIRSPTVAIHTARLRFCLNTSHSFEKLDYVLKTLKDVI